MGMRLSDTEIKKLLPAWMRNDDTNKALAASLDDIFRGSTARIKTLREWDQIDELNDEELDELAWELNIDWYSSTMEIDRKRETIKIAAQVMEKRGTKWAVERLISAYFGTGYVEEWFENGGEPYTFKIKTTNPNIGDEGMANFIKQVEVAKSARSHLDGVYYFEELEACITYAASAVAHIFEYVKCGTRPRRANVGHINRHDIIAQPSADPHRFEYRRAGDGTIAGTYPDAANAGAIDKATIRAQPSAAPLLFEYLTKAGDGTKAGTKPDVVNIGQITEADLVGIDATAAASLFEYIRRAGTTPGAATLGELARRNVETTVTSSVHCFNYIKCGTKKCGQ